jgi:butyryl-CoA dehydrogenase
MMEKVLNRREMDFLLYEFLSTGLLLNRRRYAGFSKSMFDEILQRSEHIAKNHFANHYRQADKVDATLDNRPFSPSAETRQAWNAIAQLGILAAHHDLDKGGLQLPAVICAAARAYFGAANIATSTYHHLTIGVGNLINNFASDSQKSIFVPPLMNGRYSATMALSEPGQGSSLSDIKTTAYLQADGSYRIHGEKMFVTNGEHNLTENIIHLVLAKIGADDELNPHKNHGLSLFIVPKILVNNRSDNGAKNTIHLMRNLKKMGCRNAVSTQLRFGDGFNSATANGFNTAAAGSGAEGFLIGKPNRGLYYMFQMLNESRIGVGTHSAVLAYQAYRYSLHYAGKRIQGRLSGNKQLRMHQVPIIKHADIRRMLISQKCYAEAAMALCFYAVSLTEDVATADTKPERQRAMVLLDVLTPVVKSWSAKYGCQANDMAIQILAGYGYLSENPVEQLYRDQRLNQIQEGTEAIQALDLLGRKVSMQNGYGFEIFLQEVRICLQRAESLDGLSEYCESITEALELLKQTTESLIALVEKDPERGLANANEYLDFFARLVIAWIWMRQAIVAYRTLHRKDAQLSQSDCDFYQGKIQAARFYFTTELPKAKLQAELLADDDPAFFGMQQDWF